MELGKEHPPKVHRFAASKLRIRPTLWPGVNQARVILHTCIPRAIADARAVRHPPVASHDRHARRRPRLPAARLQKTPSTREHGKALQSRDVWPRNVCIFPSSGFASGSASPDHVRDADAQDE
jgi:hypothetical protein